MSLFPPNRLHVPGHFGELLQGRLGAGGPVALLTLPCLAMGVTATHWPGRGLSLYGSGRVSPARARRFLARLGLRLSGRIVLSARAEPGAGTGVSTAALLALARLAGAGPVQAPVVLAGACLVAEGASDPLMLARPEASLWASREGRVLARMPALPRHEVIGGFWGRPSPTDPEDSDFADISDLVASWQAGGGLAVLAGLASESARRCQTRRGPVSDPTPALARELGALGWMRAHTGSARGLIFAPGAAPPNAWHLLREAGLHGIVRFRGGQV